MEDFENFESQITTEIKQQSLSLDVDIGIGVPLSRTPSLRSTNISTYSDGGRISSLDGKSVKMETFFLIINLTVIANYVAVVLMTGKQTPITTRHRNRT